MKLSRWKIELKETALEHLLMTELLIPRRIDL
jgi:hypothetical protein